MNRKGVTSRFMEGTLKGELLGFEAYSWAAQRVTGVLMLVFLVWHLYTLSAVISGPAAYDRAMNAMQRPIFKIGEVLLVWVVVFHALNGLRLILLNLFPGLNHKRLAYTMSAGSLVLALISIPMIF